MGVILKAIGTILIFNIFLFFGIWNTILQVIFGKNKNEDLKNKAKQLNIEAAKKLKCGAQSVFVRLPNGINLHVVEAGNKNDKLIVLLHGFPETWHSWSGVIPTLVKQGYFVVAPDMRGYNLSDKPKSVSDYDMRFLVSDIKYLIENYKRKNAVVVAHDWGGVVSWALAQYHPEVVEKLVIMNAYRTPKRILKHAEKTLLKYLMDEISFICDKYNPRKAVKALVQGQKHDFDEESLEVLACAYAQDNAFSSMINYYKATFRSELRHLLGFRSKTKTQGGGQEKENKKRERERITVPTLVLWGKDDHALVPELALVDKWVENVSVVYIPDCSHWVPHDAPEIVSREVLKFIS